MLSTDPTRPSRASHVASTSKIPMASKPRRRSRRAAGVAALTLLASSQAFVQLSAAAALPVAGQAGLARPCARQPCTRDTMALREARQLAEGSNEVQWRPAPDADSEGRTDDGDTIQFLSPDEAAASEAIQAFQKTWEAERLPGGEAAAASDPDAPDSAASATDTGKGKAKASDVLPSFDSTQQYAHHHSASRVIAKNGEIAIPPTTNELGYRQRPPFRVSSVGPSGRSHRDVGLFPPDLPLRRESAKRKHVAELTQGEEQEAPLETDADGNSISGPAKRPDESMRWAVSPQASMLNPLRSGWSKQLLDDDVRLSVPDERRRPRSESAAKWAHDLLRKKWWRWKPGEGYVFGTGKDWDAYTRGPGIALAQLLPPKERPYTSPLPLIPNNGKRDLIVLIVSFIGAFLLLAVIWDCALSVARARANRAIGKAKGKVDARDRPLTGSRSAGQESRPLRTKKRREAGMLRELCHKALSRGSRHASQGSKHMKAAFQGTSLGSSAAMVLGRSRSSSLAKEAENAEMELLENGAVSRSPSIGSGSLQQQKRRDSARASGSSPRPYFAVGQDGEGSMSRSRSLGERILSAAGSVDTPSIRLTRVTQEKPGPGRGYSMDAARLHAEVSAAAASAPESLAIVDPQTGGQMMTRSLSPSPENPKHRSEAGKHPSGTDYSPRSGRPTFRSRISYTRHGSEVIDFAEVRRGGPSNHLPQVDESTSTRD